MDHPHWIWQHADWPHFHWQPSRLAMLLRECAQVQGRLLGMLGSVTQAVSAQNELDTLLQNILTSSAIEGEQLNVGSVRSSLARRMGLQVMEDGQVSRRSEGLAELMMDATEHFAHPFTLARLFNWHHLLFPYEEASLATRPVKVASLRGEEPMQVVSGRLDRPTVHFEAPPRLGLEQALNDFLEWFKTSRHQPELDPLLRAGIAYFWFVTLHPFDDGNGRLTRAIADMALAQGEHQSIRFYAMSASILEDRAGYYNALESSQKATLDITDWLLWFLQTLLRSMQQAITRIDRVLDKTRFWQRHHDTALSAEQLKVLNRLLDAGEKGFEHGISAAQYQAVARVSKATATRHLADLLEKNCLVRLPGGGRNTRYQVSNKGE
ncbi:Fic family protein [Pseudomonas trivialis]|uniref:Fic family protein n=1 Tax=Pseudomonas trivialis TaxID=200450 RepID=UPI0030D16058